MSTDAPPEAASTSRARDRMATMPKPPDFEIDENNLYSVTIATERGTIVAELDPQLAPNTVNNFVSLAKSGYYNKTTFHRVEPGFVIQGGDPEGTGRGGPGYKFADEPVKGDYTQGALAMANAGPDTNGSQFFVCLDDLTGRLPKQYNLFGHVTEGLDTVLATQKGDVMLSVNVRERPRG
jgi:cyclophilin family peptidyl-prolyl cis-trans isomerase